MNWSGISDKSLFGKVLRLPLKVIPPSITMPIMQGSLKGKKWIVGSSHHGCWLGSYEMGKQLLFEKMITPGSVVFDLGGHVGFYTLLAAKLVGPSGKVFVFEPVPNNIFYLKEHLRLNSMNNVTVIEAAVADKLGETFFEEGATSTTGHMETNGKLRVDVVSLDALVNKGELPTPNYIKVDIEGAEALALSGARATLIKSHPIIFLATHSDSIHQECCQLLQSLDYQLQTIDGLDLEHSREILAQYTQKES